jgi:hypothetical protein
MILKNWAFETCKIDLGFKPVQILILWMDRRIFQMSVSKENLEQNEQTKIRTVGQMQQHL